jgi:hypothetical protein
MMILIGNSRALMWSQALLAIASQLGYRFGLVRHEGCSMPRVANPTHRGSVSAAECNEWKDGAIGWANQQNPKVVVVASGTNLSNSVSAAELPAGYAATLKELQGPGRQIFVIGDGPKLTQNPPACLAANSLSALKCATSASEAISIDEQRADLDAARQAGAGYVNITPWLCTTDVCPAIVGNYLAYHDQDHLTTTFTKSLVPVLQQTLNISHA